MSADNHNLLRALRAGLPTGGQFTAAACSRLGALVALVLVLLAASFSSASAQSGIGDGVDTVGTVARDANGQDWAYLLWQATQPGLISNRVFAVYSKPGD